MSFLLSIIASSIIFLFFLKILELFVSSGPKNKSVTLYTIVDKFGKIYYTSAHEDSLQTNELMTKESLKHLDLKIVKLTGEI